MRQNDSYFHFHCFVRFIFCLNHNDMSSGPFCYLIKERGGIPFFSVSKVAFLVFFHRQVFMHPEVDMSCYIMWWVKLMVNIIFGRKYLIYISFFKFFLLCDQFCDYTLKNGKLSPIYVYFCVASGSLYLVCDNYFCVDIRSIFLTYPCFYHPYCWFNVIGMLKEGWVLYLWLLVMLLKKPVFIFLPIQRYDYYYFYKLFINSNMMHDLLFKSFFLNVFLFLSSSTFLSII